MNQVRVIENLLSEEECRVIVAKFLDSPLLQAERNGANYKRSVLFDRDLAEKLALRVKQYIPKSWNVVELSDRFRFSKYVPGGEFALHQDGIYQDPRTGRRSGYTLSIYLNDDYVGGETTFFNGKTLEEAMGSKGTPIPPKPGRAILFPRQVYHCGNKVLNKEKYLLRTDLMVGM